MYSNQNVSISLQNMTGLNFFMFGKSGGLTPIWREMPKGTFINGITISPTKWN